MGELRPQHSKMAIAPQFRQIPIFGFYPAAVWELWIAPALAKK